MPLKGSFERDHSEVLSGDTNQVISQHLGVRNSGTTGLGYASFMVPPESTRGAAVACSTNLDNISLGGFVPHLQPTAAAGDSTAIGKVEQVPRA